MEKTKIIIQDNDNYGEVLGLLTLEDKTFEEFDKVFAEYKDKRGDDWFWEDFLDYLTYEVKWKFCWERDTVWTYAI